MKILVLIVMSFLIFFKPLCPVVDYVSNYEYIVKMLCENKDKPELHCNGKCYLKKQLAKEAQESEEAPVNTQDKVQAPINLFCESRADYQLSALVGNQLKHSYNASQDPYSILIVSEIGPPPRMG